MLSRLWFFILGGALVSLPLQAQEIDVNLSNDSAQFRYIKHSNGGLGQSELDAGLLYTTTEDVLLMLGLQVVDEAGTGSPGLHAGLGGKLFAINADTFDLFALALGGQIRYAPPSLPRFALRAELFVAPDIVTFMDVDRLVYQSVSLEYEILSQATAYIGHRRIKATIHNAPSSELEDAGHLGLRILF